MMNIRRHLYQHTRQWRRIYSQQHVPASYTRCIHTTNINQYPEIPFKLADIGEGIAEVEILQWFVKEGDKITQFQNVCEVQSDKATVEITSRYDGIVTKVHFNIGDMAPVGSTLIDIDVAENMINKEKNKLPEPHSSSINSDKEKLNTSTGVSMDSMEIIVEETIVNTKFNQFDNNHEGKEQDKILASPSVRRLAREHQISLDEVRSTSNDGRILKADLLEHIRLIAEEEKRKKKETKNSNDINLPTGNESPSTKYLTEDTIVKLNVTQKAMLKAMTASLQVPHFQYGDEIDMDALSKLRKTLKPLEEAHNVKLSYMPFLLKAASLALRSFPMLNASLSACQTQVVMHASHNISIAIDTPHGLLVPNVKNVQDKTVVDIAVELKRLQKLAQENRLALDDIAGGTFSLSNIGSIGGTYMSPVLFMPQVAIGAIGKIQVLPRYNSDALANGEQVLELKQVMNVSWSGDHRVIDGATMARFSNEWKKYVEYPMSMLSEMK